MYKFTDDFLLGNEMIDNDHRYLFELLNKSNSLLFNQYVLDRYTDIKNILEELANYADEHFAREEKYMVSIKDPEIIIQRYQHNDFDEKVMEFMSRNIDDDDEQQKALEEITEFIAKWLMCHIIGSDTMIGKLPPLEEWMMKENPCEFTKEYEIGVPLVDSEHKQLFDIIGRADRLSRQDDIGERLDDIAGILAELKNYTEEHFSDEEEYMESIQYPALEAQKRAHAAFIYELDNINMDKVAENPKVNMDGILEFLLGWLINHILKMDMKIVGERRPANE